MDNDILSGGKAMELLKEGILDISNESVEFTDPVLTAMKMESSNDQANSVFQSASNENMDTFGNPLDSWDQDVLLSNAGIPEINPLLELEDSVDTDFNKILNDWDHQLSNLQPNTATDNDEDPLSPLSNIIPDPDNQSNSLDSDQLMFTNSDASSDMKLESNPSTPDPDPSLGDQEFIKSENNCLKLGQRKDLAGILISSGPGGHFETYEAYSLNAVGTTSSSTTNFGYCMLEPSSSNKTNDRAIVDNVIEATDVDNLLEQFENSVSADSLKRKTEIMDALNNHYLSSSSRNLPPGKVPKIVSSKQVKDSLPVEIIERIKTSSQKKKLITLIEPVHKNARIAGSSNPQGCSTSGSMTSRFSEAGTKLTNNKMRQLGVKPVSPQQAQVNLDHDYCSSNKIRRSRLNQHQLQQQRQVLQKHHLLQAALRSPQLITKKQGIALATSASSSVGSGAKTVIRLPSTPNFVKRQSSNQPHVISIERKTGNVTTIPGFIVKQTNSTPTVKIPEKVMQLVANATQVRRDSDTKKDSGLESGEVSDASNNEEEGLYSRLPPYLTTNVASANGKKNENSLYDRLPAYVTGISRNSSEQNGAKPEEMNLNTDKANPSQQENRSVDKVKLCDSQVMQSEISSSSSNVTKPENGVKRNLRSSQIRRTSFRSRTASSSSSSSSTSSSSLSSSSCAKKLSPPKKYTRSVVLSPKKSNSQASLTTRALNKHRISPRKTSIKSKRARSPSPSSSSSDGHERTRSRSPIARRRSSRKRSYDRERFTRDRQKREQERRHLYQEKQRQVEERRVVYVGKITEGTSRADLRKRFEVFGPIEEISVHFRDRGDNYGFVTFRYKVDAYEAVEHGNDDPAFPKVDLCFGGRRNFCKEKYSDLDSIGGGSSSLANGSNVDFDALLKQARAGMKK